MSADKTAAVARLVGRIADNWENGNLSDCRALSRRVGRDKLVSFLIYSVGWSDVKAFAVADYLKGRGSYRAACDAS